MTTTHANRIAVLYRDEADRQYAEALARRFLPADAVDVDVADVAPGVRESDPSAGKQPGFFGLKWNVPA